MSAPVCYGGGGGAQLCPNCATTAPMSPMVIVPGGGMFCVAPKRATTALMSATLSATHLTPVMSQEEERARLPGLLVVSYLRQKRR